MAVILCLETATTNCSVAISVNGKTIALKEDFSKNYSHAEQLHLYINEVLNIAKLNLKDIDAIAVSKGPGSYTGLRIGVSAAKGLCFALDKPLISISTLQSLANQIPSTPDSFIIPMLDARRMEVYASVYNEEYMQVREIKAEIITEDSFSEFLEKGEVFFPGNANTKVKDIVRHPNAIFIDYLLPSANEMGRLAEEKHKISDFENVAYFEPFYLKDFVGG